MTSIHELNTTELMLHNCDQDVDNSLINHLGYKTSENSEKHPSQLSGVQANTLKCSILFNQQSKTPKYEIYCNVRPRKARRALNQLIFVIFTCKLVNNYMIIKIDAT